VGEFTSTLRGLSFSKSGKKMIDKYKEKKSSLTGTNRRICSNGFRSEKKKNSLK
jgi:hypothetical protein